MSSEQFDAIEAVLDAPLEETSRFARLLARPAVDERPQGRGIGAALLKDAIEWCYRLSREVGTTALIVHCQDEQGRKTLSLGGQCTAYAGLARAVQPGRPVIARWMRRHSSSLPAARPRRA